MAETLATEASGKTRLHIVLWRTKTDAQVELIDAVPVGSRAGVQARRVSLTERWH
jgi:hypothetical protein